MAWRKEFTLILLDIPLGVARQRLSEVIKLEARTAQTKTSRRKLRRPEDTSKDRHGPRHKTRSRHQPNNEAANDSNTSEEAVIVDTHLEAVQQPLKSGKERGYVTHDELNSALPQES